MKKILISITGYGIPNTVIGSIEEIVIPTTTILVSPKNEMIRYSLKMIVTEMIPSTIEQRNSLFLFSFLFAFF